MLACEHRTIKNGFQLHKCEKYGMNYLFKLLAIGVIMLAMLYNIGLIYLILKRKISYREKDHNRYIKRKELEYVLELSDNWRKQSFFVFSSFKGSKLRLYFKPVYNIFLLFLVSSHAF